MLKIPSKHILWQNNVLIIIYFVDGGWGGGGGFKWRKEQAVCEWRGTLKYAQYTFGCDHSTQQVYSTNAVLSVVSFTQKMAV